MRSYQKVSCIFQSFVFAIKSADTTISSFNFY